MNAVDFEVLARRSATSVRDHAAVLPLADVTALTRLVKRRQRRQRTSLAVAVAVAAAGVATGVATATGVSRHSLSSPTATTTPPKTVRSNTTRRFVVDRHPPLRRLRRAG